MYPHSLRWCAIGVWLLAYCLTVGNGAGDRKSLSQRRGSTTRAVESERLRNVKVFDPPPRPPTFFHYVQISYIRDSIRPEPINWELALDRDYVGALLYHRGRPNRPLMLIRQFRATYFVNSVRQLPENRERLLPQIDWSKYPVKYGETLELCGGMMDKAGKTAAEVVKEEIEEEGGYSPPLDSIQHIKTFITDIGFSGALTHLFYAEVDESMRKGKGGGLVEEGESMKNVFISIEEARELTFGEKSANVPPNVLYALAWFLQRNGRQL